MDEVYPIAGSYATSTGKGLEPKYERLEDLPDSDMTGLRLELHGGTYKKKSQMAVIDMQCDPERTGNEKSPVKDGKDDEDEKLRSLEANTKDNPQGDNEEGEENSLRFVSYKEEDEKKGVRVLRLDWRTKYACQSYEEDDDDGGNETDGNVRHWGFFTWFIIMYINFFPLWPPVDADKFSLAVSSSVLPLT